MAAVDEESTSTFSSFGLDHRLLKAISDAGWSRPTLVQEKGIPLALEGKDILAKGRTGSGKTALFLIPIIQKILEQKIGCPVQLFQASSSEQHISAIILAPTKDLCSQIQSHVQMLTCACSRSVRCFDLSADSDSNSQRSQLCELPDIVVGTPSRVLLHIDAGNMNIAATRFLVVDEADLIFSFGFEADMRKIMKALPKVYQAFLTSATLTDDVKSLKKLLLHNPVTLRLEEAQLPDSSQLTQYHIRCVDEDEKFLIMYALLKLRLIRGKTIVFVNSINKGYRLKLYLQQFGIQSCVLNSELPISSRVHVVQQFNSNLFDCLIASDDTGLPSQVANSSKTTSHSSGAASSVKRGAKADPEAGIARGIDFQRVSNVVNFDFPKTVDTYIHRVGRTARGWNHGSALSFVCEKDVPLLHKIVAALKDQMGSDLLKPYQFRKDELEGFRYRSIDALKAVTNAAVREARLEEIKAEILHSQKLRTYFAQNPRDYQVLRHDMALHIVKEQPHLHHVPDYIVPAALRGLNYAARSSKRSGADASTAASSSKSQSSKRKLSEQPTMTAARKKFLKKKSDPLQSFSF